MQHIKNVPKNAEGFPGYLQEALALEMDVNDWIEQKLGWLQALPVLEKTVFPYLNQDAIVCELGPGTGRHARHLLARLPVGEIHLVDKSFWIINFLSNYFKANPNVHLYHSNGLSLPISNDNWADLAMSFGTFIELNLGLFHLYSREFFRVLKPRGYCVLNYLDISTDVGWRHLETNSLFYGNTFTYHSPAVVDKIFTSAGFEIVTRIQITNTYLICRKPSV